MMRVRGLLVCALAALCLSAGNADAARVGEHAAPDGRPTMKASAYTATVLSRVGGWADAQWPLRTSFQGLPVCPSSRYHSVVKTLLQGALLANGMAYPDRCGYDVRADLQGLQACATVVHEAGHVAGRTHTIDGSVMDADGGHGFGPCQNWFDYPCRRRTSDLYACRQQGKTRLRHWRPAR